MAITHTTQSTVADSGVAGQVSRNAWNAAHTIEAGTITDVEVAAANKDGVAGTASMRTLGTGAQQAAAGDHGHAQAEVTGLVAALALKAPLASPAFTDTPTAPTADPSTNTTQIATTAYVRTAVAALVDSAPTTLDTLDELAFALGEDPNFATTMATALGNKQPLDATLTAVAALDSTAGLVEQTGADTFTKRALGVGASTSVPTRADADARYAAIGSDPWTYVKLGTDFSTSDATGVAVTGLAFTPAASKTYVVEGFFLMQSTVASSAVRPGVSWPTGTTNGAACIQSSSGAQSLVFRNVPHGTSGRADATSAGTADASYPGLLSATLITGGSPSGSFQITLATEIGTDTVRMMAGSWLRYREI
jgi:hypothetical protein